MRAGAAIVAGCGCECDTAGVHFRRDEIDGIVLGEL